MRAENVYVSLLVAVVDVLGASLQAASLFLFVFLKCLKFTLVMQKQTPDSLTQSLDTLFALARTGLNIADPSMTLLTITSNVQS